MIRLTPQRRFHVTNKLAVLAAVILGLTSYTGFISDRSYDGQNFETQSVSVSQMEEDSSADPQKKRKLNISSLLFGRG